MVVGLVKVVVNSGRQWQWWWWMEAEKMEEGIFVFKFLAQIKLMLSKKLFGVIIGIFKAIGLIIILKRCNIFKRR